ncbi:unnamed protein product [Rotaria sp. Silwood1]|nr:unnamed protein product [Rotaria sp. Silwood1]
MKETNELQSSSSSSSLVMNSNRVFVHCLFPDKSVKIIKASVTNTVAELTAKITALQENQTMAHFLLWSDSSTIDDNEPDKRLADFCIQPGTRLSIKDVHRVCEDLLT